MAVDVWHFTDSSGFGGAELVMLDLAQGLPASRWRSTIVHHPGPGAEPLAAEARRRGIPVIAVPRMPDGIRGAMRAPALRRLLRQQAPAVFHANLPWPLAARYPLLAAVAARRPAVVTTVHLYPPMHPNRRAVAVHRALARLADRHIAVSATVARRVQERLGWPAERITLVHNGIDGSRYGGAADHGLRTALGAAPAQQLALCVGRLTEQKGIGYAIEAVSRRPDVLLVVAGDGPQRTALERQAVALRTAERVRFLGHRDDVPRLLAACDVLLLPSLWEGLPLSLVEAMAACRPIIASHLPEIAEAVSDGETALLVPPADGTAIADAIVRLAGDPGLGNRLAAAALARQRAEFSLSGMVEGVEAVYTRLLEGLP